MVETMEIQKGFKQTEVGTIPSDWDVSELNALSNVIDSLHQTPNFSKNGYAMVRVTDIKSGNLNLENTNKVSEEIYYEFIRNYKPKKGDIVLSRVGSYGIPSFVDTEEPFCMGQNTVVIEPKIINKYLYYILNSSKIRKQVEDGSFGSGYKSLSLKNIKELKIPLPPTKAEQTAIATTLSDVDALIQSLEKLIAKKRNIKQGATQVLLKLKEGWVVITFDNAFDFLSTASYSRNVLNEKSEMGYVHYGDIHTQWTNFLDFRKDNLPSINNSKAKTYPLLKEGDLIMADASEDYEGIGKSVEVKNLGPRKAISGLHTFLLRDKNRIFINGFRGYISLCRTVKKQLDRLATGLKVYGISKHNLKIIEIPLPPRAEQTRIATILSDMDAEISALETKLTKCKQIKQGMMQELLTGKIRLV